MSIAVRFAPSPTGPLHAGNARTALFNFLFARKQGGRFILRLDDTDAERSSEEHAQAIGEDLLWLGIKPDQTFRQSERIPLYRQAAEKLKQAGCLYPCYETPQELARRRRLARAANRPPVYDRAALGLSAAQRRKLEEQGRKPHWRFRLSGGVVRFDDLVHGRVAVPTASLSDPVLIREDGGFLYSLPSAADDLDMGVSHVIRGEDHLTNSAVHIELAEALGGAPPRFAHHGLITGEDGAPLSKRRMQEAALRSLRGAGIEPVALNFFLARGEGESPCRTLDELAAGFKPEAMPRAPLRFEPARLARVSAQFIHAMDYETAFPRLATQGIEVGEALWLAVRGNLSKLADVKIWRGIVEGEAAPVIKDRAFIEAARACLPPAPWGEGVWEEWTKALAKATGRKGRALYLPLRLALTGLDHGPELAALLPLIGRDKALARLKGEKL